MRVNLFCCACLFLTMGGREGRAEQLSKLTAPNGSAFDRFGQSVAITDDYVIVGAHREDSAASNAGSVYVYEKGTFTHMRTLTASDAGAEHFFGWSLAAEGNEVLIGAPGNDAGAAYLFDLSTGLEIHKFISNGPTSDDQFGHSVSLSSTHVLVGSWLEDADDLNPSENSGTAVLFDRSNFNLLFTLSGADTAAGDQFGASVVLSGDMACVGSVFADHSGFADAGAVYVFDVNTGGELRKIIGQSPAEGDVFGTSVATTQDLLVIGASEADPQGDSSGAAYLYQISTGNRISDLLPSGGVAQDRIGSAVAISDRILVGAFRADSEGLNDAGAVHVFDLMGNFERTLIASDAQTGDFFGHAVAGYDGGAVIGSFQDDDLGSSSGSAYVFSLTSPKLEDLLITISSSQALLTWQGEQGVTYRVYTSEDLGVWSQSPIHTIVAQSQSLSYQHPRTVGSSRLFYQITASLD